MPALPGWIHPAVRQTWVSLPTILAKLAAGMGLGFSSCLLTAIKRPDSDIQMDIHASTWFVSSFIFSMNIGYVVGAFTMSRYGRRNPMVVNSLPAILGQVIIYFATDFTTLIIGRVLVGSAIGSHLLIGMASIGEYVSPKNRGMLITMVTAAMYSGSLLVHAMGNYVSWRMLSIISMIPFILCFTAAYTSPESPSWLAERKQYERSREAFYWLRGRTEDSTREIEELIRAQRHRTVDKTFTEKLKYLITKCKKKNFLQPLGIFIVSSILIDLSGRHVFAAYARQLIQDIVSDDFNVYYCNIIIDILLVTSSFAACYLMRVMRLRTLLFSTGFTTAAVLALACLSLYLVRSGVIPEDYSMVTLVLFGLYLIFGSMGCSSVPLVLSGELFPLEHRAAASYLSHCVMSLMATIFLKVTPYLVSALHIYGAFLVLAVGMSVTLGALYYILPETSNKTLQEIEKYFEEGTLEATGIDEESSLQAFNQNNKV